MGDCDLDLSRNFLSYLFKAALNAHAGACLLLHHLLSMSKASFRYQRVDFLNTATESIRLRRSLFQWTLHLLNDVIFQAENAVDKFLLLIASVLVAAVGEDADASMNVQEAHLQMAHMRVLQYCATHVSPFVSYHRRLTPMTIRFVCCGAAIEFYFVLLRNLLGDLLSPQPSLALMNFQTKSSIHPPWRPMFGLSVIWSSFIALRCIEIF